MLENRATFFGLTANAEEAEDVGKILTAARTTLVERHLFDALRTSMDPTQVGTARDQVNNQIRMFGQAKVEAGNIEPSLWRLCNQVVAGKGMPRQEGCEATVSAADG